MTIQIKDALKTVGGISTSGSITTTGNGSNNIGSTSNRFNTIVGANIHVYDANAQHYASLRTSTTGTADTQGVGRLVAGNNIASGTAGNAKGQILLYGTNTGYTALTTGNNTTSNITVELPSAGGKLMMAKQGADDHWGLVAPTGVDTGWTRVSKNGLLPYDKGSTSSSIGSTGWPFNNVCGRNFGLYDTNGQSYGTLRVQTAGTAETQGETRLVVGNSLATGTANNSYGRICLYGKGAGYTYLTPGNNGDSGITLTLPSSGGTLARTADIDSKVANYLPLSGGIMTGELAFSEVTSTTYPAKSSAITWNGSTDGANIYYQVDAADKGRLVLNTRDDTDCVVAFAYNGTIKSTIDTNGYFSGTSALADACDRVNLYRTAQKDNANYVPGHSRLVVREFTNESSNMPSAHFYHIYTGQGSDANYNTQLAVGMTTEALCFRNRHNGSWTGWKKVSVEGHTHNYAPSSHGHTHPSSGAWWNEGFVKVGGDGVCEVGKYMDWHLSSGSTNDHDGRFTLEGSGHLIFSGTLGCGSYAKIQGTPLSIQSSAPGCGGVWIQI